MPAGSSKKRERQYEHIKEQAEERGTSDKRAKEIAARTVNKERARSGEAKTASKTSTRDPKSAVLDDRAAVGCGLPPSRGSGGATPPGGFLWWWGGGGWGGACLSPGKGEGHTRQPHDHQERHRALPARLHPGAS
ncbi:hypothetical protein [Streptomyces decoyicus]|uniref:hypothetical protein n=1 Tax=Streptomyces decoyicus TaxID=249567 RepID=UPI003CC91AC0